MPFTFFQVVHITHTQIDSYIHTTVVFFINNHRDNLLFFFLPHRSTASLMGNSSTRGPSITILNNESSDFSCSRFCVLIFINLN